MYFAACLLVGCTNFSQLDDVEELQSVNGSHYSKGQLSLDDKLLIDHVLFNNGELVCLLDGETALEKGISKEKYDSFLEYLNQENQRIDFYLRNGAIVFYNGKPYAKYDSLYQYIDTMSETLKFESICKDYIPEKSFFSQANSMRYYYTDSSATLWCERIQMGFTGEATIEEVEFKGPSTVKISKRGSGNLTLEEKIKGLTFYVPGIHMQDIIVKWGTFENDMDWRWKLTYISNSWDYADIYFMGLWELIHYIPPVNEDITCPQNPDNPIYKDNLPRYVTLRWEEYNTLKITILKEGIYRARVFKKSGRSYWLFSDAERNGFEDLFVAYPPDSIFWLVIERGEIREGKMNYIYVGDRLFFCQTCEISN